MRNGLSDQRIRTGHGRLILDCASATVKALPDRWQERYACTTSGLRRIFGGAYTDGTGRDGCVRSEAGIFVQDFEFVIIRRNVLS